MAHAGRPVTKLQITDAEREELQACLRVRKAPEDEKLRMRIVLGCADGHSGTVIAQRLGTTVQTVSKWRRRYQAYRLAGLTDAPRAGRPRSVDDERVQHIVDKVGHSRPANATHWSVRQMSREAGVSPSTVQRIWHAFGLKPHLQETFKLSTDPHFVDKARDVVGLYMAPPDRALVLRVHEKSQIQALDRTQPGLPLTFGKPTARARTITSATARRRCLQRWMWPLAKSSDSSNAVTAAWNFCSSSKPLMHRCRVIKKST